MSTKKELRSILNTYLHSHLGQVTDSNITELLTKLLSHSQPKKLDNFDYFFIEKNYCKSNAFYIKYLDGSQDDFSYNWIIRSYSPLSKRARLPDHITWMLDACRNSIYEQILEFRNNNVRVGQEKFHVDHYPIPFVKIVADWYEKQDQKQIACLQNPITLIWSLSEPHLTSFKEYHRSVAQYRLIPGKQNMKNSSYGIKIDWYSLINKKS